MSQTPEFTELMQVAEWLLGPEGCPWDREQTHQSLTRYVVEEAYEVVEAIEALAASENTDKAAFAALCDELGDLLYQVIFQSALAEREGAFNMDDVMRGIREKLVRRHQHVFGNTHAGTSEEVMQQWEKTKKEERGSSTVMNDVTVGLPALLYVHKIFRKAAATGLPMPDAQEAQSLMQNAFNELSENPSDMALGELLAAGVAWAHANGKDAEAALRGWAAQYRATFQELEHQADGQDLSTLDSSELTKLWNAKVTERQIKTT